MLNPIREEHPTKWSLWEGELVGGLGAIDITSQNNRLENKGKIHEGPDSYKLSVKHGPSTKKSKRLRDVELEKKPSQNNSSHPSKAQIDESAQKKKTGKKGKVKGISCPVKRKSLKRKLTSEKENIRREITIQEIEGINLSDDTIAHRNKVNWRDAEGVLGFGASVGVSMDGSKEEALEKINQMEDPSEARRQNGLG